MKIREFVAVDPGDTHTGVALFARRDPGAVAEGTQDWVCWNAYEASGFEFAYELATMLRHASGRPSPDLVVVERFQLYSHKAQEQIGSEFETVQLIGAIRFMIEDNNERLRRFYRGESDLGYDSKMVELVMQPAAIKNGTRAWLRRTGVPSTAKKAKAGGHALDAELHGWYFLANHYNELN